MVTPSGFSGYVVVFLVTCFVPLTYGARSDNQGRSEWAPDNSPKEQNPVMIYVRQGSPVDADRRDPFLPLVSPQSHDAKDTAVEPLGTSKPAWVLLGIMSGRRGTYASIQNSKGKRYIVTSGTAIFSEGVVVNRISETELELTLSDQKNPKMKGKESKKIILSF